MIFIFLGLGAAVLQAPLLDVAAMIRPLGPVSGWFQIFCLDLIDHLLHHHADITQHCHRCVDIGPDLFPAFIDLNRRRPPASPSVEGTDFGAQAESNIAFVYGFSSGSRIKI